MRKIAVVTGTRAEYGLLYWIIKGVHESRELELILLVTGMHLSPEFGSTVKEIEKDGFPISERIEMLLSSDTETALATSMGIGMLGFAKAYERLKPDMLLVLGDRFETFAAVAAAAPFRIPVAHIHGGESTEGAIDELFRHAITKMSHVHFTATEEYRARVIQMGENPRNVFNVGAPGLESIYKLPLLDKETLWRELGLPQGRRVGAVTFHPATLDVGAAEIQITELLCALQEFSGIYWIFTMPNADTGGRVIAEKIKSFADSNPERGSTFISLGQMNYLSLLRHADIMVGNSSSGIIEAPSFGLPVVNIGCRQQGRIRAGNVIDVPECERSGIVAAIAEATSKGFRASLKGLKNPYGEGDASTRILETLKAVSPSSLVRKNFHTIHASREERRSG